MHALAPPRAPWPSSWRQTFT